jgi:hypothetical protein
MELVITYFGSVDSGKLKIRNRKEFDLNLLAFEGKEIEGTLRRKRNKRSLLQNSYYHGCVVPAVRFALNEAGFKMSVLQVHELLKFKFLKDEVINETTGEIITTIGSTTGLTKSAFMDYIAEIQQWAAEYLNCVIPDPNEQTDLKFTK